MQWLSCPESVIASSGFGSENAEQFCQKALNHTSKCFSPGRKKSFRKKIQIIKQYNNMNEKV